MTQKNTGRSAPVSVAIALVILAAVALWFRSGYVQVDCGETSVKIHVPYWVDMEIRYSEINAVTCRNDLNAGERTVGVGSSKLLAGTFQNEEFGSYTLYAYTDSTAYVILTSGEKPIVIGMNNQKDIQRIYETIKERVEN